MYCYVYLLYCSKDGSIYVGFTTDLKKRLAAHEAGGTKTTRERGPVKLIYYESYTNVMDARRREKFLKSGRGREVMKKQLAQTRAGIV